MWSTPKSKLNYHNRLDRMRSIKKTRQDNDVTNRTGVIFVEYDIELSRLMGHYAVYNKDETEQQCDRLYRSALC